MYFLTVPPFQSTLSVLQLPSLHRQSPGDQDIEGGGHRDYGLPIAAGGASCEVVR